MTSARRIPITKRIALRVVGVRAGSGTTIPRDAVFEPDKRAMGALRDEFDREIVDEAAIPSYTHWNPLIRLLFDARCTTVLSMVPEGRERVLDLGCGTGTVSAHLSRAGHDVVGVDLRPSLARAYLDRTTSEEAPELVAGSAATLPVTDSAFGTVLAMDVLEHVENLEDAVAECERILTADGTLVLSGPSENAFYRLGRRIAGFDDDFHECSVYDIDETLRSRGWDRTNHRSLGVGVTFFEVSRYETPG